jgi:Tol biopolymer transport system component
MNPIGTGQVRLTRSGTAANPQLSADGKKIAYDQGSPSTGRDIWAMNGNGSGKYQVTTHAKNEVDPTWSPDGRWLAFASDRRDSGEIFKVRSTAPFGAAIRLTTTAGTGEPYPTYEDPRLSDAQPNWSPTGNRIAFSRYIREDDFSAFGWTTLLVTMNVNGTGITEAGVPGVDCPSWAQGERGSPSPKTGTTGASATRARTSSR